MINKRDLILCGCYFCEKYRFDDYRSYIDFTATTGFSTSFYAPQNDGIFDALSVTECLRHPRK